MRWTVVLYMITLSVTSVAYGGCYEMVQVGEPGFVVIEKCGEPQRREREERARTTTVEIVRGSDLVAQRPLQPLLVERWYYDTSLNAATVISLEDRGVTKKERLLRE